MTRPAGVHAGDEGKRQRRRWLGGGAKAVLLLLATAALFELGLRRSGFRPTPPFLLLHPKLGRTLLPNATASAWGASVRTDAGGLRVGPGPQPEGAPRVLFLGGSCTFGYSVEWDDTFQAHFQRRLEAEGVEVTLVNAGVPLATSVNSRAFLVERGEAERPALIIFGEVVNDLNDADATSHQCFSRGRVEYHTLWPREEYWDVPEERLEAAPEARFLLPAYAGHALGHARWRLVVEAKPGVLSRLRRSAPMSWMYRRHPERLDARVRIDPELQRHFFATYRENLRAMTAWGKEHGVPVVFLSQPRQGPLDLFALLPEDARRDTAAAITSFLAGDLARAESALSAVVARDPRFLIPRYDLAVVRTARGLDSGAAGEASLAARPTAFNLVLAEVGYAEGATVFHADLDFQSRAEEGLIMGDGSHPTRAGNRRLGEELARLVLDRHLLATPLRKPGDGRP